MPTQTSAETVATVRPLEGRTAVVTGASAGIGRAIAVALAERGASLCVIGRNREELARTVERAGAVTARVEPFRADLSVSPNIERIAQFIRREFGRLDILVHSAGVMYLDRMQDAWLKHFDIQYLCNVRAPYLLTQKLLPLLKESAGQIVFINSSVGLNAKRADAGQYAATHFAMKAIADSLREEVNAEGIRVLTVHPGRTATPRQEALYRREGKPYRPELLLQPEDVAAVVLNALTLPRTAEVTDISIRPMIKT